MTDAARCSPANSRAADEYGRSSALSASTSSISVGHDSPAPPRFNLFSSVLSVPSVANSYPTLPSRLTSSSFCASTANSIGSSLNTLRQKPLTIIDTASSVEMPRCLQ
jgi:hypothetical protein